MADSPAKAVLDTSVYLSFLRKDLEIFDLGFLLRPTLLYMSSVVFAEIYTGAKDRAALLNLRKLYRTFERLNRLVTPDKQIWFEAGQKCCKSLEHATGLKKKVWRGCPMMCSLR